ncbi:hypothetical protein FRB94_004736 [Tulasnella sp. JGI-2019a]|nr:hypothetical protein FRB93_011392 [Tulasnella sp. JGI-2019a]KAG9012926.1 hypothetical protein FRB94_004736 [Tulasnella sp. JGI-2019a]KAG9036679.1 hypothetical protein FRB95_008263 [Tulasnella sp. JGI-2019a]
MTSVHLGGTASHVEIYKIGLGLMMMTAVPIPISDDQAFEAIKTAISCVPENQKLLINSAEFYGRNPRVANLHLVARFFDKYPELADRTFLSVKGGLGVSDFTPDSSTDNLRRSVDACNAALNGKKRIDLFECARVDKRVPIEEAMKTLKGFVEEGKFDHIGLSEVSAETIEKANKIVGVVAVEIEVSPWSYEEETKKVIAATQRLGITVVAYSPLGRGFLTGKLKKSDLAEGDWRSHLARVQDNVADNNQKIVNALMAIAEKKNVTAAQLCLAWVASLGSQVVSIPGSGKAARVKENLEAGAIILSEEDVKEISGLLDKYPVKGGRYADDQSDAHLWG